MRRSAFPRSKWLLSLDLRVRVEPLNAPNLARTTQLPQQDEPVEPLDAAPERSRSWSIGRMGKATRSTPSPVSDRLGDAGLTGILSLQVDGDVCRIVDFVLSCRRVMGRRVEEAMVHLAVEAARSLSLGQVVADLIPDQEEPPFVSNFGSARASSVTERHASRGTRASEYPLLRGDLAGACRVSLRERLEEGRRSTKLAGVRDSVRAARCFAGRPSSTTRCELVSRGDDFLHAQQPGAHRTSTSRDG